MTFKLEYAYQTVMEAYSISVHYHIKTAVKCGIKCLAHPTCDSFAFNREMKKCLLSRHAAIVGHLDANMNSSIYVADMK